MRFFKTVKNQLSLIKSNAFGFQVRYDTIRCAPINSFPYTIHYRVDEEKRTITIVALFCDYIDPEVWNERRVWRRQTPIKIFVFICGQLSSEYRFVLIRLNSWISHLWRYLFQVAMTCSIRGMCHFIQMRPNKVEWRRNEETEEMKRGNGEKIGRASCRERVYVRV